MNLYLNYCPIKGFSVNTYRNNGWFNDEILGFIADLHIGSESSINLNEAKEDLATLDLHGSYLSWSMTEQEIDRIASAVRQAIEDGEWDED